MSNDPAHVIAAAVARAQVALYDHVRCGDGTPAEVLEKINAIMSDRTLIRAMNDVGYFPANTSSDTIFSLPGYD